MRFSNYCPVCNSQNYKTLINYKFKNPGNDFKNFSDDYRNSRLWVLFNKILSNNNSANFNITLCNSCGFIFLNPRFSESEFKIKYSFFSETKSEEKRLQKNPMFNLDIRAQRIYKLINKFYSQNSNFKPRVLDYGGAGGYILVPFKNKYKCYVVDYNKWKLPNGIEYLGKDLDHLEKEDSFDIIFLLHTLEHIINPKEFLDYLCKYLKNDGLIYVEVPLGCVKEWRVLMEPLTHINFFSEESLFKLFTLCNLNVIHIDTSYQWVAHGKNWNVNIIGTKRKEGNFINLNSIPATKAQMVNFYYNFQDLVNIRNYPTNIKKIIKYLRYKLKNFNLN